MDVFRQRLEDEYNANIIITAPTVPYKGGLPPSPQSTATNDKIVLYKDKTVIVSNPAEFPDHSDSSSGVKEVQEPVVKATIIVPEGWP